MQEKTSYTVPVSETTGSREQATPKTAQWYYKRKSTDKNARPKQAGHFSFQSSESSHISEQAKKIYQIKKAEDSQIEKQNIRDTVDRAEKKRMMQPADFSETKPGSFARRSDQAEKNGLAVGEDISTVKQKKLSVKTKADILHRDNSTLQTEKMTAPKAATFTPKTKQAATKTAQTVRKKSQKEAQKQISKQVVKRGTQTAKATARFAVRVGKAVVKTTAALVRGLIALIVGGGVLLTVIIVIAIVGALVASPFGVFFSGEDKTANVTPISEIVQQTNSEFASAIDKIIADNDNVDDIKYEYYGCATSTAPNNWPDIIVVFAVKTSMNGQNGMDVVTMDDERAAILKHIFGDMNKIDHYIETIEHKKTVDNGDGTTSTKTTYEHILHIQITCKKTDEMTNQYSFTQDQRTVMNEMLSSDMLSQINFLLGV